MILLSTETHVFIEDDAQPGSIWNNHWAAFHVRARGYAIDSSTAVPVYLRHIDAVPEGIEVGPEDPRDPNGEVYVGSGPDAESPGVERFLRFDRS